MKHKWQAYPVSLGKKRKKEMQKGEFKMNNFYRWVYFSKYNTWNLIHFVDALKNCMEIMKIEYYQHDY